MEATLCAYTHCTLPYLSSLRVDKYSKVPRVDPISHKPRSHETTRPTVPTGEASTSDERLANLLFDYPRADTVCRSQNSHHSPVPNIYIINSTPVLGELIRRPLYFSRTVSKVEVSLPIVQLPESGDILRCPLTFVFPLIALGLSTLEEIMKLVRYQGRTRAIGFDAIQHHPFYGQHLFIYSSFYLTFCIDGLRHRAVLHRAGPLPDCKTI